MTSKHTTDTATLGLFDEVTQPESAVTEKERITGQMQAMARDLERWNYEYYVLDNPGA